MSPQAAARLDRAGILFVLAAASIFGTIGTARALGAPDIDPAALGALRLAIAAPLFLAQVRLRRGPGFRRALVPPILLGALGVAAFQVTFLEGVQRTGVAVGTVIAIGSAPFFTGLLARPLVGERPTRVWAIATAVTVSGGALIALSGGGETEVDPIGVLFALACGFSTAFLTLGARMAMHRGATPDHVMATQFTIAALAMSPILVLGPTAGLFAGEPVMTAIYLAIIPTVVAYTFLGQGLVRLPQSTASTLLIAEPTVATVLGLLVLDERPGALAYAGMAVVLAGLALLGRERRPTD